VAHRDVDGLRRHAQTLSSRGYQIRETPHFVVCRRSAQRGRAIVLHTYNGASIDEDVSPAIVAELGSMGVVTSADEFGDAVFAIVASTYPLSPSWPESRRVDLDQTVIWHQFCLNTLDRLRVMLDANSPQECTSYSHVGSFAGIYRRVIATSVGDTLLDVGSNVGHLPLLLADRFADMTIVGCDHRPNAVSNATVLAAATRHYRVTFVLKDVLDPDFADIGRFDTVTAIHLLEHLAEKDLQTALANLLSVARRRLIVAVPYEESIEPLYGHVQTFTAERLHDCGEWCVKALRGAGRFVCEDVNGGFLMIDTMPNQ
jgi:SAM-dependent methyltransferase